MGYRTKVVRRQRHEKAAKLRTLFGGKCSIFGYDKCMSALEFHHIDRSTKLFSLSVLQMRLSWAKVVHEAKKCLLVCANCHREVESGIVSKGAVLSVYEAQSIVLDVGSIPTGSTNNNQRGRSVSTVRGEC